MSNVIKNVFFNANYDCATLTPPGKFICGFMDFDMERPIKDQILEVAVIQPELKGLDPRCVLNFNLTAFTPMSCESSKGPEAEPNRQIDSEDANDVTRKVRKLTESMERQIDAIGYGMQRKTASTLICAARSVVSNASTPSSLHAIIADAIIELHEHLKVVEGQVAEYAAAQE